MGTTILTEYGMLTICSGLRTRGPKRERVDGWHGNQQKKQFIQPKRNLSSKRSMPANSCFPSRGIKHVAAQNKAAPYLSMEEVVVSQILGVFEKERNSVARTIYTRTRSFDGGITYAL